MGRTNIHRNTNPRPTTIPFLSSTSITSLLPYFLSAPNSSLLLLSGEEERYKFIMVEKKKVSAKLKWQDINVVYLDEARGQVMEEKMEEVEKVKEEEEEEIRNVRLGVDEVGCGTVVVRYVRGLG
ncbi:hypothetical protein M8J75_005580 [Diaphorina citri]|nr:hypothetical protein M8J75_005580 [Diaphorina citri]